MERRNFARWAGVGLVVAAAVACAQQQPKDAPGSAMPTVSTEIALAKKLVAARKDYQTTLEQLRAHYVAATDTEKLRWTEEELKQFHRVPKHAYVLDLDVPGPGLKATANVPAANDLFKRAMSYKESSADPDNPIRAELLLQQVISQYPSSNKIGLAAYNLGDLYESRTFKMYRRAAAYYERCFQWDPNTGTDARLRAARLYDKQLNERSRAIEMYKSVVAYDHDTKRLQEAQKRLGELSTVAP